MMKRLFSGSSLELGQCIEISYRGRNHRGKIIWLSNNKLKAIVEFGPPVNPTRVLIKTKRIVGK